MGAEFVFSTQTLIRIFVFLLYVPVGLFAYWRLIPRLSTPSKRLATIMLAVQVVVIVLSLEIQPSSSFSRWLWDFHEEWNIPATIASTQLAVVGGLGLLSAWFSKDRLSWHRLYLIGIGLVFLFLAIDEYLALHEFIGNWEIYYIALGSVVVTATLIVASRSLRKSWIWHISLLTGLGISVVGAMIFNALPIICGNMGSLRIEGCLQWYFQEESLEFLGIWLTLIALLGHFTDAAPAPSFRMQSLLYALPVFWVLLLFGNSLVPRLELSFLAEPASVDFKSGVSLRGYRINSGDRGSVLRLYASATQENYLYLGYSIHLVDQASGDSVAHRNEWADRQHGVWLFGPNYIPVYGQWMDVSVPPQAPTNRALWVVLTLWRRGSEKFVNQKILSSNLKLLSDSQVILDELVLASTSDDSPPPPFAVFDNGFTLAPVDLPERARAGDTLAIPFTWHSDADGGEDHVQFLHLGHEENGAWWVYDQQPLGARLPTRLWYDGLTDSEVWQVPLPADLAPGRYTVYTGLYRSRDQQRVPVSDVDGKPWLDARVLLGRLIIER